MNTQDTQPPAASEAAFVDELSGILSRASKGLEHVSAPLPWDINPVHRYIRDSRGNAVRRDPRESAFIVRACNSYDENIATIQDARNILEACALVLRPKGERAALTRAIARCDAALKGAKA